MSHYRFDLLKKYIQFENYFFVEPINFHLIFLELVLRYNIIDNKQSYCLITKTFRTKNILTNKKLQTWKNKRVRCISLNTLMLCRFERVSKKSEQLNVLENILTRFLKTNKCFL